MKSKTAMGRKYSCIVIDDEAHGRGAMVELISKLPQLVLLADFSNGMDAMDYLNNLQTKVDFVFSDIEMPDISGLELSRFLRIHCHHLLFATAYADYALAAFDVLADGFLLKPIKIIDFIEKVNHLINKDKTPTTAANDTIFIKTGGNQSYTKIDINTIISIDAGDHYPTITTTGGKYLVYFKMKDLASYLSQYSQFIRIHRSTIISVNFIKRLDGNTVYLNMDAQNSREVGGLYRKAFSEFLKRKTLTNLKTDK